MPTDGIINFHKPIGITSAKALYRVRSMTGVRKSGHAGSLDPAAEGVLILCLGRATKLVEQIMELRKTYRTTARLDVTSESYDSDRPLIPVETLDIPTQPQVAAALESFVGEIDQVPPRISAVKIGGVPAYKTAGREAEFPIKPRKARIYRIEFLRYEWPELEFEMECGRGTYVRSVVRDLGEKLGTGGCLTSLVRSRIGPFCIDDSVDSAALETLRETGQYMIEIERARRMIAESLE